MIKLLANVVSYLFHPLLMATYGCLLLFFGLTETIYAVFTPFKLKIIITSIVFVFTFLIPVLNLLILFKLNYVTSLKLEDRKERFFPLLITAFCYFGLVYLLYDFNIWPVIKLLILGAGLSIFITAFISLFWQISAHMVGIGGLIGALISISFYIKTNFLLELSCVFVIAGVIGFSRLYLKAHTQAQVYVGFIGALLFQSLLFIAAKFFPYL